jgi:putative addiction module killer protein
MEGELRQIQRYVTAEGKIPFSDWFNNLKDIQAKLKITKRIARVELGILGDCKSVGDGIFELRINYGPGYRIYFGQIDLVIILLLCGGDKQTQAQDNQKSSAPRGGVWKSFARKPLVSIASLYFSPQGAGNYTHTRFKKQRVIGKIINGVTTMPKSLSYHSHLMEFLADPQVAAAYLEDILQDNEGEPRLLALALNQVADALGSSQLSPVELEKQKQKIDQLLQAQGSEVIYKLEQWLGVLGLKLSVTSIEKEEENPEKPLKIEHDASVTNLIYS